MTFDTIIDRFDTHSAKWDMMEKIYGVPASDGIAMWVADMDFRAPDCVQNAIAKMHEHGIYGYYGDDSSYRNAICWWMQTRHGWDVDPQAIFTTHGLVNGTALCVDTFTEPGDGVVLMTPVYHAFAKVIRANNRRVVECDLALTDGRYEMDFDAWDQQLDGSEKMMILCSPHNPGGRVWTRAELDGVAAFAKRHDLILVSDEIHHDLVFPGTTHTPMAQIEGIADRLIMMTATTKTFNIAGSHSGNVIIPDPDLRAKFADRMAALGMSPNSFGLAMAEAAYSPEGAAWVDDLLAYLDGNRQVFDAGINAIPGLTSMPLEATYLAWVDFSGTGMDREEYTKRVEQGAKIAVNHGPTFGSGGDDFLRFNLATPRALVQQAVDRMQAAFADLQ
ncbi:Cystathionine beta-lyase PatB [Thalassovita gelatinovora]|uniref:cysteine-S-conjugate beta-lyase n=1 Tax=Thalassovita gelatinovora TaxID=53501 RepID=A0A0P1FDH1_THAGE|nr:MalY/PatB family protein [Thalassovita gelatinovora]QIZ81448.1 pyridoxal phosphate-dependent aminotransferase [Thalassovita gelatinovora]CUH66268.1 Cystathionine beta-lyase PatB [Thalassovita gelatinovora]SEQ22635.1 cystathione beta-lyase [Thalassovita gelatinovora]